ncbi:uncharacterized protein I303_102702 [Kwoniella dejecticola CBS 10117]|uniref:Two-component system sensor protein n=1 Tax=Kwoniella dejecticola CBS 10117 TaxID=1296121 RepID=A0A1A6A9G7_9TREE|nr:uncharacterized protein I303_02717 [Kwoniella dejecticola CBS 10117]OBR86705.1 hypothetical protein I303_02717 [Kwoniella dejecticola CBS 10117]
MALMGPEEDVDLSALPLFFLEAYPFPAFILVVPITSKSRPKLISRDTDVTIRNYSQPPQYDDDLSPLGGPSRHPFPSNPVTWGNEKWYQLTQGRTIGDCLDMNVQNRLQAWIEGESEQEDFDPISRSARLSGGDEIRSEGNGGFKMEMKWPKSVTLLLAKTIVPLSPPSTKHTFCVITSQRFESLARPPSGPSSMSWSSVGSPTERPSTASSRSSISSSIGRRVSGPLDEQARRSVPTPDRQQQYNRESFTTEARSSSFASSIDTKSSGQQHRDSSSSGFRTSIDVESSVSQIGSPSTTPGSMSNASSYFSTSLLGESTRENDKIRLRSSTRRRTSPSGNRMSISAQPRTSNDNETQQFWQMIENIDWSKTPLGDRSLWKDALDPLLSVTLESKSSDCVWLGPDLRLIYNKGYSQLVDHPKSLGAPAKEVWASIWDTIEPYVHQCMSGTPVFKDNDPIFWRRYGNNILMEHYHSWRYVPIAGKDGAILGIFNQSVESTEKVLQDRRLTTSRDLSERMLIVRSMDEYYQALTEVLEENPKDAPFFMCYKIQQTESTAAHVQVEATLQAHVGVPEDHPSVHQKVTFTLPPTRTRANFGPNADRLSSPTLSAISALSSGSGRVCHVTSDGHQWPILKALNTRQCVIVDDCTQLIEGFEIRQWGELPFAAIVIPICSDGAVDVPDSVMVMGLNVRRPFDADYDAWLNSIRSQLVSSLATVKAAEAEQRMEEANARMEKAKAAWFRGAAHDLRSPLTLIAGPLSDLLEDNLTPKQKHALTTAQRNIDRLLRLVNALMDFSRLEAGRMEGRFLPTDLGEFTLGLASLFRPAVERLGIHYTVDVEPRDQLIYIDATLFETVLSNIIGNALKYTEQGSITVQVRYTNYAEVSVIDTGVGIPEDEIPQVTEWYHRATTAIHAGTQGSGLGLALAKELLRLHDGDLVVSSRVASSPGQPHGSTFTARIPLAFKPPPPASSASQSTFGKYGKAVANEAMRWTKEGADAETSSDGATSESLAGSGSRFSDGFLFEKTDTILLVEDNMDMRHYIKQIFASFCTVIEASNGQEALELAIANPPNLILSDMLMPKMNGLELLQEIRNHPNTKIVPMVLLSAIAGDESRVEALMMGAEDYLAKPFKPKELVARVHLHLQVGKKRANLEKMFNERETEIAVLSDYCPSGIMRADGVTGEITYANRAWREQSDLLMDDPNRWPEYVDEETRNRLQTLWMDYLKGNEKELRVNWRYNTGKVISGIFVKLDQVNPSMSGVLGCTTDITHEEQRLVEAEQRRQEAEESKHQQELLIDLTSHEIRTPVSAILQCSSLVKENLISLKEQLRSSGSIGFCPTKELLDDLEEDVEALESIYQCGLVQERIAGDVLSLARIQLDMLSLYDIEVDLRKEARKVSSVFASEAKTKKIDLVLKFGETLELGKVLSIKTDPVRLGQVVTNLISNAIRFTTTSDTRKITVRYDISFTPPAEDTCALPHSLGIPNKLPAEEDTPLWLFVSVTDTGPGMSPKELAVLFKRFAQGNKMIHTKYGGSGLGLFICRKITELLGGRIEVLSQLGEGSVFRFFIKTRCVAPPSALAAYVEAASLGALRSPTSASFGAPSSPSPSPSISIASSGTSSLSGPATTLSETALEHILIVEDNIINQTVLKRQIVKAGLTCDVANNGLEALNLIREAHRQWKRAGGSLTGDSSAKRVKKPYDVILMDLEMPVMDGLTAIKELREAEQSGSLNRNMVIALTGNARQGQIDQALAAGMDDVVIKPYVLKNLLTKIRALTAKRAELEQVSKQDQ